MIKLMDPLPSGMDGITDVYGFPLIGAKPDPEWEKRNITRVHLGFPLRQSWDLREIRAFPAHRLVGLVMVDALQEIHDFYGLALMRKYGLDLWGGVYNPGSWKNGRFYPRLKRGGSEQLSTHAWGIAIDMCPELGPFGEPGRMPWIVVEAFLKRGFEQFPQRDQMHFQAATGY